MTAVTVLGSQYVSGLLSANQEVCPDTLATTPSWPFVLTSACVTANGTLAADKLEVTWQGGGGGGLSSLVLSIDVTLERPGSMAASLGPELVNCKMANNFGGGALMFPGGIFATVPHYYEDNALIYYPDYQVPTATWPLEAGSGTLWLNTSCANTWSGTMLTLQFTPDP